MRLAILASHPIQYYGPLFREVAKRIDLHVFFAHKTTAQQQAQAGYGVPFEWDVDLTGGYSHSYLENVASDPGTGHFSGCDTPEIGRKLRQGRFDALLMMGWHLKSFVQGLSAAKRLGIRVLVRGDSQLGSPRSVTKRTIKRLLYPALLRLFDAALYVGERSRAYYQHYGYPPSRLFFSPHCVDTEWFSARATLNERARMRAKLGIRPEVKVALFVGRLLSFKRPFDLVEAVAQCRMKGNDFEVIVAGDGELKGKLVEQARTKGVPLHSLGFCNQTKMPAVYSAADCLVLPSDSHETWGLVANEALACGRPIIVSDACGCAPDLVDVRTGRTYPIGEIPRLSVCLTEVMNGEILDDHFRSLSEKYSLRRAADGIELALSHCSR